jgi:hypothetical protein
MIDIKHLTKPRQALVTLALDHGYNITRHGNNEIFILKGRTCRSRGVVIFEDGQIIRTDVRLDLVRPMTIEEAKKHLRL